MEKKQTDEPIYMSYLQAHHATDFACIRNILSRVYFEIECLLNVWSVIESIEWNVHRNALTLSWHIKNKFMLLIWLSFLRLIRLSSCHRILRARLHWFIYRKNRRHRKLKYNDNSNKWNSIQCHEIKKKQYQIKLNKKQLKIFIL